MEATGADRLAYYLPKPGPDRRAELTVTPLELIDRLAALIPPPRLLPGSTRPSHYPVPQCGTEILIIPFVTETASAARILAHIGDPTKAPVLSPARGPPAWEAFDQTPVSDPMPFATESAVEFDQTVTY